MKNKIQLILLLLFLSCKKESQDPIDENLSPIWEVDFQVGLTTCINPVLVDDMVVFSSYDGINTDLQASSKLIAFNKKNGEINWEWKNIEKSKGEDLSLSVPVFEINKKLYFSKGPRSYSINGQTGETIWFKSYGDFALSKMINCENLLYLMIGSDYSNRKSLININFQLGDSTEILNFYDSDSAALYIDNFLVREQHIFYIKGYKTIINNAVNFDDYLIKYDNNLKKNIYETSLSGLKKGTIQSIFEYDEETILAISNSHIFNFESRTGQLRWSIQLARNMFYHDFLTTNSGLWYVVTEDNLMSIDIATGNVIWNVIPAHLGLNSRISLHKDVLYFVSGSRLNAFDARDGRQLMSLEAPSIKWSGLSDGFNSVITLDAENDRIYTASFTAAYCYPTLNLDDL